MKLSNLWKTTILILVAAIVYLRMELVGFELCYSLGAVLLVVGLGSLWIWRFVLLGRNPDGTYRRGHTPHNKGT